MIIKYTTKRDTNGNRYCLLVDMEKKTVRRGYNMAWSYDDFITVTKRDRNRLHEYYIECGFTEEA